MVLCQAAFSPDWGPETHETRAVLSLSLYVSGSMEFCCKTPIRKGFFHLILVALISAGRLPFHHHLPRVTVSESEAEGVSASMGD